MQLHNVAAWNRCETSECLLYLSFLFLCNLYHSSEIKTGIEGVGEEEQRDGIGVPGGIGSFQAGVVGGYPGR